MELNQKAYLQQKVLPGSIVYWQITEGKTLHDTTINPTEWCWKLAEDRLETVMTGQVSLVFGKLFRSILKIFNSDNTYTELNYLL